MTRTLILALAISAVFAAPAAASQDDDPSVDPQGSSFQVGAEEATPDQVVGGLPGSPATNGESTSSASSAPTCDVDFTVPCRPVTECREEPASPLGGILLLHNSGWIDNLGWCDPSAPEAPPTITPAMVLRAFRQVPLPASKIVVQPPDGRTLVNFKTNFYTEVEAFEPTVALLGQKVTLKVWPSGYVWNYGDNTSDSTDTPGGAYPELLVTHEYQKVGKVKVSVDTVWSAEYKINDGDWSAVDGTVTIDGLREPLRVLEAAPVLTGFYG